MTTSTCLRIVTLVALTFGWGLLIASGRPAITLLVVGLFTLTVVGIATYRYYGRFAARVVFFAVHAVAGVYLTLASSLWTHFWGGGESGRFSLFAFGLLQFPLTGLAILSLLRAWTRSAHDSRLRRELEPESCPSRRSNYDRELR